MHTSQCSSRASIFHPKLSMKVTKPRFAANKTAGEDTVDVVAASMATVVATIIDGASTITAEVMMVHEVDSVGVDMTTVAGTTMAAAEAATTTILRQCP